jgi:hypothetical protein
MKNVRRHIIKSAPLVAGIALLQLLGRRWGSTNEEATIELPGDDLVSRPSLMTNHAITIDAPPAAIWPWLVQMGWGRAGWYTARWVDLLLFPANGASSNCIVEEWQTLQVGDWIPDGPPDTRCGFTVAELEACRYLVLHSIDHLPPGFRQRFGAWINWTWSFVLTELDGERTRFLFRSRVRIGPWWLLALYHLFVVPADFVMARQMLSGIEMRVKNTNGLNPYR